MKTFDFEAFAYDGEVYCTECLPPGIEPEGEEVHPVFAGTLRHDLPDLQTCPAAGR